MLFRNGKPNRVDQRKMEMSPEMLRYLIEGVSDKVAQNLSTELARRSNHSLGPRTIEERESEETMQQLAKAMTATGPIQGKNFDNLGEVKKVDADKEKTKQTLNLLKDIK